MYLSSFEKNEGMGMNYYCKSMSSTDRIGYILELVTKALRPS